MRYYILKNALNECLAHAKHYAHVIVIAIVIIKCCIWAVGLLKDLHMGILPDHMATRQKLKLTTKWGFCVSCWWGNGFIILCLVLPNSTFVQGHSQVVWANTSQDNSGMMLADPLQVCHWLAEGLISRDVPPCHAGSLTPSLCQVWTQLGGLALCIALL